MGEKSKKVKHAQTTLEGGKLPDDWAFSKADTGYLTHGLHEYPARMIPQIAEKLLDTYTEEGDRVLDPFCGSGTTLVEAKLALRNAVGNDINPLAVLLAKVKSTPINFGSISFDFYNFMSKLETDYLEARRNNALPEPPYEVHPNLLHWFKDEPARDLEFLYRYIEQLNNETLKDFLKIVLSDTIFRSSNIDHRSSRFIRILKNNELVQFKPNALEIFRKKLLDSVSKVSRFTSTVHDLERASGKISHTEVNRGDAKKLPFPKNSFDAIVTSPPYGEEKNTVAYARWSKFSVALLRLNHETLKEAERRSLGYIVQKGIDESLDSLPSPTAKGLLSKLIKTDRDRTRDAIPFFFDYLDCLKEGYRVLRAGSCCCIVIGDRSIRKQPLDMEAVTVELAGDVGFVHKASFFREIPMKLIPWTTPTGRTISRESIIILKKE